MSKMLKTISIVLADDHEVVRQAIRCMLEREPGFEFLGEAGDGLEAVQIVAKLKPDVLVTDLMVPRLHGLEVIRQVKREQPKIKVVVLSMHSDEHSVTEAMRNGALGYVLKESTSSELVQAIRDVAAGHRYLSRSLADRMITGYLHPKEAGSDMFDTLTSRERLVFQLAAEGMTSTEIAKKLFISPRTAETHRANLMRKLALSSQTDLVRYAIRKGIISA